MKEKEIDWKNIEHITEGNEPIEKQIQFIYNNQEYTNINKITIEYTVYKYETNDKTYYQRIIILPFYCKSSWGQAEPEPQHIIDLLQSRLVQKYKDILVRDCYSRLYKKKLQELTGIKIRNNNILYHSPLDTEFGSSKIGQIWKDFIIPNKSTWKDVNENLNALSWKKFVQMMTEQNCAYCGISVKQINKIELYTKRARGYTLEIDQKNSYEHYEDENCVACCYWCNNAKTDEFSVKEFEPIANGIFTVWNKRLTDAKLPKIDKFPTEVYNNQ